MEIYLWSLQLLRLQSIIGMIVVFGKVISGIESINTNALMNCG